MINDFEKYCNMTILSPICDQLVELSNQAFSVNNGNIPKWEQAIADIQQIKSGKATFKHPYVYIDTQVDIENLTQSLKQLMPWRKGPYQIGNLALESEWRGDMKWDRIKDHIKPLAGKSVLDVGSGNGYFTYLMAMQGAEITVGIEPFLLFNYQFQAIRTLISQPLKAYVLPLKLGQMPEGSSFDSVFSMGVLYHQKDHMLHLKQLIEVMTDNGELILETLIKS